MIALIALIAIATTVMATSNAHGIVELDEVSFGKVVGREQHVLVTLNEFSWKSPENFNDVADAFKDNADVLVAKLDASQLPEGHALKVKTTPTLRFYSARSKEFVEFVGSADTASDVIEFVQFQLSPKVRELVKKKKKKKKKEKTALSS
jgi:thioredoxin-related protein